MAGDKYPVIGEDDQLHQATGDLGAAVLKGYAESALTSELEAQAERDGGALPVQPPQEK